MSMQPSSATDAGERLIAALAQRDFAQLADRLTPDVRMRALIPPGVVELSGAEAAAAKFAAWFGDAEVFELIGSGTDSFADRLHVFYRLRVTKPGNAPKLVEQQLLCACDGDRIDGLDLVCTGFRPDEETWIIPHPPF
jgi:SnoaL-like domain